MTRTLKLNSIAGVSYEIKRESRNNWPEWISSPDLDITHQAEKKWPREEYPEGFQPQSMEVRSEKMFVWVHSWWIADNDRIPESRRGKYTLDITWESARRDLALAQRIDQMLLEHGARPLDPDLLHEYEAAIRETFG